MGEVPPAIEILGANDLLLSDEFLSSPGFREPREFFLL